MKINTSEEALGQLFNMLEEAGLHPENCDGRVAFYDNRVPCGVPTAVGDVVNGEYLLVPRKILGDVPTFFVTVQGSSMRDAGLEQGDRIQVEMCRDVHDGDIVLVAIDGGDFTVKTYFKDDRGQVWLVPRNDDYDAIQLTEEMNARIIGRVTQIMKSAPRESFSDCSRRVNATRQKNGSGTTPVSKSQAERAVCQVAGRVEHARQWYAVYRALVQRDYLTEGAYSELCDMVRQQCPTHGHLPVAGELRRMCVGSFRKRIALWEEGDAPVSGQRFLDYLAIGREMLGLLK